MQLVSFNLFRTLGLPGTTYIKPEDYLRNPVAFADRLRQADWVLFPEYWQLNALIYGLGCRIFPSESSYRTGHNKIEMTRACQVVTPCNLPNTLIESNTTENAGRVWQQMESPFVAKLPKASQGEGVWLIESREDWRAYLARTDVIYVQEYLPIDKDLRVVIVGDEVITAYWRHQSDYSFHTNVSRGGQVSFDDIPTEGLELALMIARALGINHAGFDIAMVGGQPYLLEFNRLFGNKGIPGGGKTLTDTILRYLTDNHSGNKPIKPKRPPKLPMAV